MPRKYWGVSLSILMSAGSGAALAQTASTSGADGGTAQTASPSESPSATSGTTGLEEIIVTAQRRAENLQNVPISVQALTAEQLANRGHIDATDLTALVPGLILPVSIGSATPFLRGSGNTTIGGGENAVAFYIDGIYLELPSNNLMSFNNIERVEVLKGPQGTLFGRNAVGGLIQVITKDPTQATEVDASVGYGSYNDLTGNLFASSGLTPNLAASIALTGEKRFNGWGNNLGTGDELFTAQNFGVQNKFLFTDDSKRFTLLTNVIYNQRTTNEGAVVGIVPGTFGPGDLVHNIGQYDIDNPAFDPYTTSHQTIASIKAKYDFDWAQVWDLLAYEQSRTFDAMNLNAVPVSLSPTVNPNFYYLLSKDKTWTDELQLQSASDAKLHWLLGGFLMWNRTDANNSLYSTYTGVGNYPALTYTINDGGNTLNSYAGYAQATYPVLEATRLTIGLRYSVDEKEFYILKTLYNAAGDVTAVQNQYTFANAKPPVDPNERWSKLNERVSLDHEFTRDIMGYVAFNTGFKGGEFSTLSPNNPAAAPEEITAYTAGFKSELLDHRLRLNVEGFYNELRNIQLKTTVLGQPAPLVYNAASGTAKGVDMDFEALLVRGLTLSGGVEYLDAHYDSFPNAPCYQQLPTGGIGPVGDGICNLSGATMIRSPTVSFNLALRYQWMLNNGGEMALQVGDAYNSGFFWDPDHLVKQDSYHNVSASATWTLPNPRYQLSVWGKNLTGSHIWASAQEATPYESYYPGEPATYGATFSFHY
jgi:iron complex outermembrane recepter protein